MVATRGFTLIELLFVVALVALLATLAGPSFQDLIRNSRLRTTTFDLYSSLMYARSEAIKRNADIDIVPVAGGWINGWKVQLGASSSVLRAQDAVAASISIDGPAAALTYRRDGRLTGAAAIPTFSVFVSGHQGIPRRCVNVRVSGQANIQYDYNRDGSCANG